MKKILFPLIGSALLSSSLYATQPSDPFMNDADFARVNQYINSLIESHFTTPSISNFNYPRTNIRDDSDKIVIEFDLAGVNKKDVKLTIDDKKILTLSGKKEEKKEKKDANYVRQEIFYGSFTKSIQLPQNVDENRLTTEFKNGILTITIAKKKIKKPKEKIIPIQ
jgi:HSP20 family protein